MNDKVKGPFWDELLDKALEEFGRTEPRAGLESRVLANLRIEQERLTRARRWWGALGSRFALSIRLSAPFPLVFVAFLEVPTSYRHDS